MASQLMFKEGTCARKMFGTITDLPEVARVLRVAAASHDSYTVTENGLAVAMKHAVAKALIDELAELIEDEVKS